jgi:Galactose oxidase, central domain/Kelch motif
MTQSRYGHSATLLPNGEVLVAGGTSPGAGTLTSAEVYNPSTGVWKTTGSLHVSRAQATAVLENGEVLTAGGYNLSNGVETVLASAEVYNPSTGLWSVIASTALGNVNPAGVLLANNDVLIANEAQFYNPVTAAWVNTGALPKTATNPMRATLLDTGNVLASGTACSYSGCGHVPTITCFLYTTASNSWSVTASMNQSRIYHTSTLLPSGKVLVVGGYTRGLSAPTIILGSAELYTP